MLRRAAIVPGLLLGWLVLTGFVQLTWQDNSGTICPAYQVCDAGATNCRPWTGVETGYVEIQCCEDGGVNCRPCPDCASEDGFAVERRAFDGTFAEIARTPRNYVATAQYRDQLILTKVYCYRVRAFNVSGLSAYTNEACTPPVTDEQVAPSCLTELHAP